MGSSCGTQTQLYLIYDLNYIDKDVMISITDEVTQIRRVLIGYQKSIV
ncbi:MAG: four helix bundle protein [Saprospiraceae bacterium]